MDRGRTAGLHFSRLFVFCVSILLTNYFISSRANANDAFVEIGIGLEQADAIAYTDRKRCNLKMGCFFEIEDVLINFVALSTGLQVSLASRNGDFFSFMEQRVTTCTTKVESLHFKYMMQVGVTMLNTD